MTKYNMSIPVIAFLILYLLFAAGWLIFSLIAIFHMMRYGQINFAAFLAAFAYVAVAFLIINVSYQYLSQIDWSASLHVLQRGTDLFGTDKF